MKSNVKEDPVKLVFDLWLSNLLHKSAYKLEGNLCALLSCQFPKGKAFIGTKIPVEDVSGMLHLQSMNFQVIDTNLQFKRPPLPLDKSAIKARFATHDDIVEVQMIAREEFVHNRFQRDPGIDNDTASHIKEEWAANFFTGKRGKWMVVIEDDQGIGGFLLLLHDEVQSNLIIDLIGVASRCRNKGFAHSMVAFALNECLGKTVAIKVGTQISNLPSILFYTKLGFKLNSAAYVLHLHLKG